MPLVPHHCFHHFAYFFSFLLLFHVSLYGIFVPVNSVPGYYLSSSRSSQSESNMKLPGGSGSRWLRNATLWGRLNGISQKSLLFLCHLCLWLCCSSTSWLCHPHTPQLLLTLKRKKWIYNHSQRNFHPQFFTYTCTQSIQKNLKKKNFTEMDTRFSLVSKKICKYPIAFCNLR